MGVIHKLKQEVVDYILQEKIDNPKIGCRQLAENASQKFQTNISKSSVNIILKNAQLSSPVGRRNADGTIFFPESVKKFKIPEQKKKELFVQPDHKIEPPKITLPVVPPAESKKDLKKELQKLLQDSMFVPESEPEAPSQSLPLLPDPLKNEEPVSWEKQEQEVYEEEFPRYVKVIKEQKKTHTSQLSKGMGFIFLKSAQWEMSRKSIFAESLKKYLPDLPLDHFGTAADGWLEKTFEKSGEFPFIPQEYRREIDILDKALAGFDQSLLAQEWQRLIQENALKVAAIKIDLERGSELYLDPLLTSFSLTPQFSDNPIFIHQATQLLSKQLMSNSSYLIFRADTAEKSFGEGFSALTAALGGESGRIFMKEIFLLDEKGKSITSFHIIPKQKRRWIVGVHPDQAYFKILEQKSAEDEKHPYYHIWSDQVFYYSQRRVVFEQQGYRGEDFELRVIVFRKTKNASPELMVLTNDFLGLAENIANQYLIRWPYQNVHRYIISNGLEKNSDFFMSPQANLKANVYNFHNLLNSYALEQYFELDGAATDLTSMISRFYDISGRSFITKDIFNISLTPPPQYSFIEALRKAVYKVNLRNIYTPEGLRVVLEIN